MAGSQIISQSRSGATSYFLQDGQGSTRTLINSAGTVTDTYSYTAFGEIYNQTGTIENKYLYTGQQYDSETNLYSLRARYYSPEMGRFLSQDTYSYNFSNPIELNRYGYAINNPINFSDPSGNSALSEYAFLLGVGTTLGAAGGAINAFVCGGDVASGAIIGAGMGLGFTALSLIIGPQASLVLGMGAGSIGLMQSAHDMRLNGFTPCNGTQMVLAIAGLWLGARNFQSGPPSMGMATAGGGVVTSGQSLVVVGNTVTTLEQLLSVLGVYMAVDGGDNNSNSPSQGVSKFKTSDLPAVKEFVKLAKNVNSKSTWGDAWIIFTETSPERLFLYWIDGKIRGMMLRSSNSGAYEIFALEGTRDGAGINLFKFAIQNSVDNGYKGALSLHPTEYSFSWYTSHFPGYIYQDGRLFWSSEAALRILNSP